MSFPLPPGVRLGRWQRVLLMAAGWCLLAGFILAWQLTPDDRGFGTHQQLGFPPCSFQVIFGIPCPSCGGTTSCAHFVRGEWPSATQANPAAFLLALGCLLLIPWCWCSSWLGRTWGVDSPAWVLLWFVITVSAVALLQWGYRLALL